LGIRDDKVVMGLKLNEKEKDTFRNVLANLRTDFYPACMSD